MGITNHIWWQSHLGRHLGYGSGEGFFEYSGLWVGYRPVLWLKILPRVSAICWVFNFYSRSNGLGGNGKNVGALLKLEFSKRGSQTQNLWSPCDIGKHRYFELSCRLQPGFEPKIWNQVESKGKKYFASAYCTPWFSEWMEKRNEKWVHTCHTWPTALDFTP